MRRGAVGVVLAAAALLVLAAAGYAAGFARQWTVSDIDAAGLTYAHALRRDWLDVLAQAISGAGSLPVLLTLAVFWTWREHRAGRTATAIFPAASLLLGALLAHVAKVGFSRPRPELFEAMIAMPADPSFPSAHAMQAAALVTAWLLRPVANLATGWWMAGGAFVAAVAASRVYLQVHFPSDVVAGVAAGALLAAALGSFLPRREGMP